MSCEKNTNKITAIISEIDRKERLIANLQADVETLRKKLAKLTPPPASPFPSSASATSCDEDEKEETLIYQLGSKGWRAEALNRWPNENWHIQKLLTDYEKNIPAWLEAEGKPNSYRAARSGLTIALSEFTVMKPEVLERAKELSRECKLSKRLGDRLSSKSGPEYFSREFSLIDNKMADLKRQPDQRVHPYVLFGCLLPPRRLDVAEIIPVLKADEANDNEKNYWVRETSTLVFNVYKTSKIYNQQKFIVAPGSINFQGIVSDEDLQLAQDKLNSYPIGKTLVRKVCNQSCDYLRTTGYNMNSMRHYWVTKFNSAPRAAKLRLSDYMAHSPETSLVVYNESL